MVIYVIDKRRASMAYIFFAAAAAASYLAARLSVRLYLSLPPAWLCEYGEEAGILQAKENRCRRKHLARAVITAVIFLLIQPMVWEAEAAAGGCADAIGVLPVYDAALANTLLSPIVNSLYFVTIAVILSSAALSDVDYCIIPDQLSAAVAVLGSVYAASAGSIKGAALGAVFAAGLIILSALLGRMVSGQESFGMGDIKLMTACGTIVSGPARSAWLTSAAVFFSISVILSAVWFAVLMIFRKTDLRTSRPMAPWIAVSALAMLSAELS